VNLTLWILQGLLAAVYLAAGTTKLIKSREAFIASGQPWATSWSTGALKTIGLLEVIGALGLVLPAATGIAPVLTPLAAVGLALLQLGAITVHTRRRETQGIVINLVLLAATAAVVWGRFGPYAF